VLNLGRARRSRPIALLVDGRELTVEEGTTLAAALWNAGILGFRTSVRGEPRGPLCAMGICFECRVTVDGVAHRRSCLLPCRQGMVVETAGEAHGARG
jgi:predicted molibdopterin-dependent oxidoreductase YjgC